MVMKSSANQASKPKRRYVKRSTKWANAGSSTLPTPSHTDPFDKAIEEIESITNHKFTPSEILRLSKWI